MRRMTKLLSFLLAFLMLCGTVPYVETEVEAANFVTNPNGLSGADYTESPKLAAVLDEIFAGDIDLYYDTACTNEVYFPLGSRLDNSHMYTMKSDTIPTTASGWQCWAYANAVYTKLFDAWVGDGAAVWYSENRITPGVNNVSYDMFANAGVKIGAYIRSTPYSNGAYNGDDGHSMVLLAYDANGITYLEGNGDGYGLVQMVTRTWEEFNISQLSGRGRYICHVYQPRDMYYDDWYPTNDVIKQIFPSHGIIVATANTSAMSMPCSSATDANSTVYQSFVKGEDVQTTALILNKVGNYWYQITTSDGREAYVPSSKMHFAKQDTSDVKITDVVAPTQLTQGSKFSIGGEVTSQYNLLTNVSAWVFNGGSSVTGGGEAIEGKSYSLLNSAADFQCVFNELKVGSYTYGIYADCTVYYAVDEKTRGEYTKYINVFSQDFEVVASATTPSNGRRQIQNNYGKTGEDIIAEARKWANAGAIYWSHYEPWEESICWRTGFTLNGQTSFDCSGFVSRVLNDCGFRSPDFTPSYGNCILSQTYGDGYLPISVADYGYYGIDINDAVLRAKNGDYSGLQPGDVIGWTGGSLGSHVIFYAGMKDGTPWMVEFTGSGFLDRAITSAYQASFQYGSRFASVAGEAVCTHSSYFETINLQPTCDERGIKTYECYQCGIRWTEQLPPIGHNYVSNVCTNCGDIYFLGNLALGATYETSPLYQASANTDWEWDDYADPLYPDEYGSSLTDGYIYPTIDYWLYQDEVWCGFNAKSPDYQENGYSWIKVDLGDVYDLTRCTIWVATQGEGSSAGIYSPETVEFLVSEDGEVYESIGKHWPYDPIDRPLIPITAELNTRARYVLVRFTARHYWTFVSEIEVYNTPCLHESIETYYNDATCILYRQDVAYCADCGYVIQGSYGEYGDHNWYLVEYVESSCENEGYYFYLCEVCNEYYHDYIAPTGHNIVSESYSSCIYYGYYREYCTECGYEFLYREDEPLGHDYECIDYELPTCAEDGYDLYECTMCGDQYTEWLSATGEHDYCFGELVPPTCTEDGCEVYVCFGCHDWYDVVIPATGHNYKNNVCTSCGDVLVVDYGVELHVSDVQATAGETVTVDIVLDKNVGFTYLNLLLDYDEMAMELVSVSNGTIVNSLTQGRSYIWAQADNATATGVLATLTFAVKEDASAGDYAVTAGVIECCNEQELDVTVGMTDGKVTVIDFVYGDCNGDNAIDGKDVTRLLRYLANYDPVSGTSGIDISRGADVTGDGAVNGKDATRLLRYLANYDPITGESSVELG